MHGPFKIVSFAAVLALLGAVPSNGSGLLIYTQQFDMTGNAYSSQNDTNGLGLFAQVYDNFRLEIPTPVNEVGFIGEYFNPPQPGLITGWTVSFYADNAGQPGGLIYTTHISGNGSESFIGMFGGFPTYSYDIEGLDFHPQAGPQYWLSVYPDLRLPPQWGWSTAFPADGVSYQDFFGTRTKLTADMAFTLFNHDAVPEPGTLAGMLTGGLVLAGALRRKLGGARKN